MFLPICGQVIAVKYCMAHKGIFLERENTHLESLGFNKAQMYGRFLVLLWVSLSHVNPYAYTLYLVRSRTIWPLRREILFITAHIHNNNMLFASLIQDGVAVEDMLKEAGPFSQTVYKK